jgi:hypothetical protein
MFVLTSFSEILPEGFLVFFLRLAESFLEAALHELSSVSQAAFFDGQVPKGFR